MILGPRQEELLSWLQGIAPVGEEFVFMREHCSADLGFDGSRVIYEHLNRLELMGYIRRNRSSLFPKRKTVTVLCRLEAASA